MSININVDSLIELYKTTLEELRHHDRVNVELFIGMAIAIPALVAAMAFLLGPDTRVDSNMPLVKEGLFAVAIAMGVFFVFTTVRLHKRFEACVSVLGRIEDELLHRTPLVSGGVARFGSELDGLLIRRRLNNIGLERCLKRYHVCLIVYSLAAFGLYFGLYHLLFRAIPD